jgi:HEAT repeat protein
VTPRLLDGIPVLPWILGLVVVLIAVSLLLGVVAVVLRLRNEAQERRWDELESRWTPVILEVIDGQVDPASVEGPEDETDIRLFLELLYRISRRIRGEEQAALRELAAPHLAVLDRRLRSGEPERRARAVQLVAELGTGDEVKRLLGALDDPSPLVAMVAAQRLFKPGREEHFREVLDRLSRFAVWSRRFLAGLLAGGGAGAMEPLREVLRDRERSDRERTVAASALRNLADAESAEIALEVLPSSVDRDLQAACLRLLGRVGRGEHRPVVERYLESGDGVLRQAAVEALGGMGTEEDADELESMLNDPSPWVRLASARSLEGLGLRDRLLSAAREEGPGAVEARQVLNG